jgi:geranylgeranyl pyrophosphate synthase
MSCDLFVEFVLQNQQRVQHALDDAMPRSRVAGAEKYNEALNYAIFSGGGKRLRFYLTLIAARLGGSSEEQALALASAIEFIHTCSLVLDDLPSMDDADLRRGLPSLHLAFGEGTAILVAVALLNHAYALVGRSVAADRLPRLLAEISRCIGSDGMIAGQATELALSGARHSRDVLANRDLKTTGLMRLVLVAGAVAAGGSKDDIDALAAFGETIGKVYQIYDDLADMLGDRQSTGKSVGQDARHVRPSLWALPDAEPAEATKQAASMLLSGKAVLDRFAGRPETELLKSAADFILARFDTLAPPADRSSDG